MALCVGLEMMAEEEAEFHDPHPHIPYKYEGGGLLLRPAAGKSQNSCNF